MHLNIYSLEVLIEGLCDTSITSANIVFGRLFRMLGIVTISTAFVLMVSLNLTFLQ